MSDTEMSTVAEEIQKALAIERKRERERTEAEQKRAERYKTEPSSYLRDQAEAADRAWMLRIEQMYRTAEKKIAAEEKTAKKRTSLDGEMSAIEQRRDQRLQQIEENAEQARQEAQAEYERDREPVKRQLTYLAQEVEILASSVPRGKRFPGFRRRKGAK